MTRKGNQPKRVIGQSPSKSKKKDPEAKYFADEVLAGDHQKSPLAADVDRSSPAGDGRKKNNKSRNSLRREEQVDGRAAEVSMPDGVSVEHREESTRLDSDLSHSSNCHSESLNETSGHPVNGAYVANRIENMHFSYHLALQSLRSTALSILRMSSGWLERQRPYFISVANKIQRARDYIRFRLSQTYPIVKMWLLYGFSTMFIVLIFWLGCALRGMDSLRRMGMTSFFTVLWFSILSVLSMVGMFKFLLLVAVAALIGVLAGLIFSLLIIAGSGAIFLWLYGSFWTTTFVIGTAGLAFIVGNERIALLITTVYSIYCAWTYVGWLGLLLGLNLAFISTDVLIYFLNINIDEQRNKTSEQSNECQGEGTFTGETHFPFFGAGSGAADRSAGVASTSGADSEVTSEDEIIRLLSCTDHYSALGLSRYQQVDLSVLKREYRKKAMLVHPDKNMGNEKAAEAFKKLQNAYEILLDSLKRKAYDEELRKEELLNYFCRSQNAQKNGRHGFFRNGFTRSDGDGEDPQAESRRIACKKCGSFHVWFQTKKSKSKARWCQECKDFHQAKDGDGWVEQSSQPLLFGILQKVDLPVAYVCADSRVYDATDWYICQGMRCPANSHKPSFHVNTNITKSSSGKGSSSANRGGATMEETMTEEEFFEWLQNVMQSGKFEKAGGDDSPPTSSKNSSKSGPNTSGVGSSSKRKKKGKKQW